MDADNSEEISPEFEPLTSVFHNENSNEESISGMSDLVSVGSPLELISKENHSKNSNGFETDQNSIKQAQKTFFNKNGIADHVNNSTNIKLDDVAKISNNTVKHKINDSKYKSKHHSSRTSRQTSSQEKSHVHRSKDRNSSNHRSTSRETNDIKKRNSNDSKDRKSSSHNKHYSESKDKKHKHDKKSHHDRDKTLKRDRKDSRTDKKEKSSSLCKEPKSLNGNRSDDESNAGGSSRQKSNTHKNKSSTSDKSKSSSGNHKSSRKDNGSKDVDKPKDKLENSNVSDEKNNQTDILKPEWNNFHSSFMTNDEKDAANVLLSISGINYEGSHEMLTKNIIYIENPCTNKTLNTTANELEIQGNFDQTKILQSIDDVNIKDNLNSINLETPQLFDSTDNVYKNNISNFVEVENVYKNNVSNTIDTGNVYENNVSNPENFCENNISNTINTENVYENNVSNFVDAENVCENNISNTIDTENVCEHNVSNTIDVESVRGNDISNSFDVENVYEKNVEKCIRLSENTEVILKDKNLIELVSDKKEIETLNSEVNLNLSFTQITSECSSNEAIESSELQLLTNHTELVSEKNKRKKHTDNKCNIKKTKLSKSNVTPCEINVPITDTMSTTVICKPNDQISNCNTNFQINDSVETFSNQVLPPEDVNTIALNNNKSSYTFKGFSPTEAVPCKNYKLVVDIYEALKSKKSIVENDNDEFKGFENDDSVTTLLQQKLILVKQFAWFKGFSKEDIKLIDNEYNLAKQQLELAKKECDTNEKNIFIINGKNGIPNGKKCNQVMPMVFEENKNIQDEIFNQPNHDKKICSTVNNNNHDITASENWVVEQKMKYKLLPVKVQLERLNHMYSSEYILLKTV